MMKVHTFLFQSGQTLVEAIVVIAMVMLMVTGLISGTTASLKSSQTGKARSDAIKSAQNGMELIRLTRDNNWSTVASFATSGGLYCFGSDETFVPTGSTCAVNITNVDTKLTRTATFTWLADGITIHVQVIVSYQDGESTKTVPLNTYLTQWR